ncbi:MAG: hypothetical protein ACOC38_01995 [Promethearchaeia archaeon]
MADRDDESPEDSTEEIEKKTTELLKGAIGESTSSSDERDAKQTFSTEEISQATDESAAGQVGETFARIQIRMEDILASVEDAAQSVEPSIDEKVSEVLEILSKRLRGAGLGVFATSAVSIVREEVEKGLSGSATMNPIYRSVSEGKSEVRDIVTKASRGATRAIGRSTGELQAKLFQMYTRVQELETNTEDLRAQIRRWRSRANELEDLAQSKDESLSRFELRVSQMKEDQAELNTKLEEKDQEISTLRGQLSEAKSQIEQKEALIASLDSAEEMVEDYEEKMNELSTVKGQLAEYEETLSQKEERIETLETELAGFREENARLNNTVENLSEEIASVRGKSKSRKSEVETLQEQLEELRARWEMLYQVAEEEPDFKAYFLIADKEHTWLPLTHLSKALGIPTVKLRRDLQRFVNVGLIELEGNKVRPRKLSEVAEEIAGTKKKEFEDTQESIIGDISEANEDENSDESVSSSKVTSDHTESS